MIPNLTVRARVEPRPEAPFDRLYDRVKDDLAHDGPLARARFATRWRDGAALTRLAEAKRAVLDPGLARALRALHVRLEAPEASLASLDRLARGEAVCAVAGQQPAPLGGPLYALHKTASAVGLARSVEARTGVPCVPLFWMHGEDSDFAEIRTATVGDRGLALHEVSLPPEAHAEGLLVGGIANTFLAAADQAALGRWEGLPAASEVAAMLLRARGLGRDLGEAICALLLALYGDQGLIVVDPRLPEFRAAARPIVDRYLADPERHRAAARRAGDALEAEIGRRPLADTALESFVFAVEPGPDGAPRRHKVSPGESRTPAGRPLTPSVALRPVVQDGVFPTVAMACGAAELAYLAQLREVFEGLGVRAAAPVPRLGATWLPPAAVALLERARVEPWTLVTDADQVVRAVAERALPDAVTRELEADRAEAQARLARLAERVREVDASLPQLVDSARGKVDYQYARLLEGVASKVRQRLERRHPEWARVRYYLLPGDRLQERRLASLEPVAYRGRGVAEALVELAAGEAERAAHGRDAHLLVEL